MVIHTSSFYFSKVYFLLYQHLIFPRFAHFDVIMGTHPAYSLGALESVSPPLVFAEIFGSPRVVCTAMEIVLRDLVRQSHAAIHTFFIRTPNFLLSFNILKIFGIQA